MKELQSTPIDKLTMDKHNVYEKLLRYITITRHNVKLNLRHIYRGEIEWSLIYKQTKDVKRLWS